MELRWFCVCDKFGVKSVPCLQYRKEGDILWDNIEYVEVKTDEVTVEDNYFR